MVYGYDGLAFGMAKKIADMFVCVCVFYFLYWTQVVVVSEYG